MLALNIVPVLFKTTSAPELMDAGQLDDMPEPDDGVVSLEEFKHIAQYGQEFNLKSSALWSSVRQVLPVHYTTLMCASKEC